MGEEELGSQKLALAMSREVAGRWVLAGTRAQWGGPGAQPHGGKAFRTLVLGRTQAEVLHKMLPLHRVQNMIHKVAGEHWTRKRTRQRLEGGLRVRGEREC